MKAHWRLPRGVDELLPPEAWALEKLRRQVLDIFVSWGFEYVEPPVIEYLDSLLVGSGEDLDLQTLKVVDQVSGKQLGVRADMTSQAVRIDAHSRSVEGVHRLCYAGPVVFANPLMPHTSRVPFKAGAEIFGAAGLTADAEIVGLMLATVTAAEIDQPVLLLGHMGIYRHLAEALLQAGSLKANDERRLFDAVQRKSQADISSLLDSSDLANMMICLPSLMGNMESLPSAKQQLAGAPDNVLSALDELEQLAQRISSVHEDVTLRVDLSELSGYGYHNGPVFAVYHPQHGSALAQGGRYDNVGGVFGRARPATGFDVNLKSLLGESVLGQVVFAPFTTGQEHVEMMRAVQALRERGVPICCALSAQESPPPNCSGQLEFHKGVWQVVDTPTSNN